MIGRVGWVRPSWGTGGQPMPDGTSAQISAGFLRSRFRGNPDSIRSTLTNTVSDERSGDGIDQEGCRGDLLRRPRGSCGCSGARRMGRSVDRQQPPLRRRRRRAARDRGLRMRLARSRCDDDGLSGLGTIALALVVGGLVTGSLTLIVMLAVVVAVLWALTTVRHLVHERTGHRPDTSTA